MCNGCSKVRAPCYTATRNNATAQNNTEGKPNFSMQVQELKSPRVQNSKNPRASNLLFIIILVGAKCTTN